MDLAATHSRKITGNHFGDDTTINQVDFHYHSPNDKTREDDTKCLADLRITDPRDDKTRIEATKGGLFEDSYRWILEHSDFRQWRDDERSRLLWIKGDPGKGKTMLLCGIVNELSSETRLEDQKANTLLSYFFCQATDERINSATAVLRGLIYLVVEQQPLLISHIQKKYKHGGEALFKDVNAWTALSEIFSKILDESLERTYIIIDALDECVTDLPKLLDFINIKSTLFSCVKWIVSSRNRPDIEERLDSATQQMRLCLELNEKSISAAVNAVEYNWSPYLQTLKGHGGTVESVAFSADGLYLASGSSDDTIKIWDTITGKERQTLKGYSGTVWSVAFSADGRYLASGLDDKTIKIWDMTTGKKRQTLSGHYSRVWSVAFSADSRYLALGSDDKTIKIWDATIGKERQTLKGHSGSDDKTIKIWDATTGKERQTLSGHRGGVWSVAFSADGLYLASGSDDKTIKIWDAATGKERQTLKGHSGTVYSVAFSADGLYLTLGSSDSTIKIWDIITGKKQQTLKGHCGGVVSVAFSADSRYLASGSDDKTIKIWDTIIGKKRQTLSGHRSGVWSVAFSADGLYLASGSGDKTIKIWDATTGKEQQTLKGHSGTVYSVAFSTDGRYLASGSGDNTIKIWDATTGEERQTLKGHSHWVRSVAFSADGRYLASGSLDGTIKIWDATTGKERQTLKVNTAIRTISFDDIASYLYTEIGPIKLGVEHRTEAQSMVAQVLSPDSDLAQDQDQRRPIANDTQKAKHYGWGISTDKGWITWNGHNILWLPPEYQPSTSAVWPYASPSTSPQVPLTDVAIALGTGSGRVVVFRMSGGPYSLL
ncbi:hypothetical protein TrVGV298_007042 [Trichoderma virens]|nr:hypothetical protein TrVGV298_007042 [Trichoderma virens]